MAGAALNEQAVLKVMRDRCRHGDGAELVLGLIGGHGRTVANDEDKSSTSCHIWLLESATELKV